MALVSCSECKQELSDKATSCPHCGSPVKTTAPQVMEIVTNKENPPVFQLELTAKKWKRVILIAWLMLVVGFFIMGIAGSNNSEGGKWIGIDIMLISVPVWITGKIGAWYSNR